VTLHDDIIALGATLYWPLNDPTAPAAADDSGHGHFGVYGGPFTLLAPGPEPATFAAQFAVSGQVTCTGMTQAQNAPFSVLWYESRNQTGVASSGVEVSNTPSAANRGWRSVCTTSDAFSFALYNTAGGQTSAGGLSVPVWNKWWHAYGFTYNGANVFTPYLDGAPGTTGTSTTWSGNVSTDTFGLVANYACVVAHIAYFPTQLTPGQMSNLMGHRYDWPFGPMVNRAYPVPEGAGSASLSPDDPVVVDINTDLGDIRRAVRAPFG